MPMELETGGFTLETQQMFSVHATPEELNNVIITGQGNYTIIVTQLLTKNSF